MEDNLNGSAVMVNPDFLEDRHGRAGEVGTLTYVDPENDEVLVSFDDGQDWLYSPDALMVLKRPGALYQNALVHLHEMSAADLKTLLQISLYQDHGTPQAQRKALELARDNPGVRTWGIDQLENRLMNELTLSEGFKRPPVVAR